MIRLNGIGVNYEGGNHVLRDASFHLRPGSFHFLTGPSGSGKTTLLRLLFMSMQPTHGQIYVLGQADKRFRGVVESVGYGVFPDDGGADAGGLPHVPRSINWVRVAQRFPVRIRLERPPQQLMRLGASAVVEVKHGPACQ